MIIIYLLSQHNCDIDYYTSLCDVKRSYGRKAEELKAISLASAMETVEKLEHKLAEFAKTHKHAIQHDPEFRSKFLEMCAFLGVDVHSLPKKD